MAVARAIRRLFRFPEPPNVYDPKWLADVLGQLNGWATSVGSFLTVSQGNAGSAQVIGPFYPASYLLTGLPAASTYVGALIFVSNHSTGSGVCVSNGANWIDVTTGSAVT